MRRVQLLRHPQHALNQFLRLLVLIALLLTLLLILLHRLLLVLLFFCCLVLLALLPLGLRPFLALLLPGLVLHRAQVLRMGMGKAVVLIMLCLSAEGEALSQDHHLSIGRQHASGQGLPPGGGCGRVQGQSQIIYQIASID